LIDVISLVCKVYLCFVLIAKWLVLDMGNVKNFITQSHLLKNWSLRWRNWLALELAEAVMLGSLMNKHRRR